MARTNNLTNFLTDVASAIKEKTGDSTAIPASQFDTKIASIETGGTYQEKNITITENGNMNLLPDSGYDALSNVRITTNVPGEPMDPTTATINDVINSKTFYSNGQKLTGTMPNNGTLTYTPTDTTQTIPAGYTSGGTISAVDITNLQEYQDCLNITEDILDGAGSWYERVRYIRWRITGIKSGENVLQASEFGLCKSSSDVTQRYNFPSGTVITSNQTGTTSEGEDVSKLIDGNVDTKYCVSPFTNPCIIDIDLHSTIDLTEYGYYYYYTANDRPSDRDPLQWTLYASDDGETYNLVDTQNLSSVTTDRKALAGIWSMTLQS